MLFPHMGRHVLQALLVSCSIKFKNTLNIFFRAFVILRDAVWMVYLREAWRRICGNEEGMNEGMVGIWGSVCPEMTVV